MDDEWTKFAGQYKSSNGTTRWQMWRALTEDQRQYVRSQFGLSPPRSVVNTLAFVIGVPACIVLVLLGLASLLSERPTPPEISYRVLERQDVSYLNTPRMVCRVMVDTTGKPSRADLMPIAETLNNRDGAGLAEFTVFFYLPGMNPHHAAYAVAEFKGTDLDSFTVNEQAAPG